MQVDTKKDILCNITRNVWSNQNGCPTSNLEVHVNILRLNNQIQGEKDGRKWSLNNIYFHANVSFTIT